MFMCRCQKNSTVSLLLQLLWHTHITTKLLHYYSNGILLLQILYAIHTLLLLYYITTQTSASYCRYCTAYTNYYDFPTLLRKHQSLIEMSIRIADTADFSNFLRISGVETRHVRGSPAHILTTTTRTLSNYYYQNTF